MKTRYSILDLAIISEGRSTSQTLSDSLDLARAAEALGYERYWFAEHHNTANIASSAPVVLIGHIAAGTTRIRVGSGGIMLPNHSPLVVAEQFGTLATLYPGRIDLGLGRAPGTDPETAQAIRPDRMQSVLNFPQEVQQILQFLSPANRNARIRAAVAEGVDLPLYILGSSTDSARLAAKLGLPYAFASHFATTHLEEALQLYRDGFQPSAWLDKSYAIAGINVLAADTDAEGEQLFSSLVRMFLGVFTGQFRYLQPPAEMDDELREIAAHPAIRQMLRFSFYGSAATVQRKTLEFLEMTGVDELMVVTNTHAHTDRLKSIRLFAESMNRLTSPLY